MKFEASEFDLKFRRGLLGITFVFGLGQAVFQKEYLFIDASFIVCMAGLVGYYTNFLAIKMLFQPKQGKVLGWEGLVPKNKPQIAESLANNIQTRLLAPEIILDYIHEHQLIELGTQKLIRRVDALIEDADIRAKMTMQITSFLKKKGPELLEEAFNFSESLVNNIARNPDEIEKHWGILREKIVEYIKTRENRQKIGDLIKQILTREIPRISKITNDALESFLNTRGSVGGLGMAMKSLVSFDEDAIKNLLERFVNDPQTAEQLMGIMDVLVERLQEKLNSQETQDFIIEKVEKWVFATGDYARKNLLPNSIEKLQEYLNEDRNWQQLDAYFIKAMEWFKTIAEDFMKSEEGREILKTNISNMVHKINLTQLVEEQVMQLDTDELESMILDNTGGNLVMIQILGGFLGLIAGLIQVHVGFSIPVSLLIAIAWIAHYRNERYFRKKAQQSR
ncbi:DUF445 family protein [Deltaproteobacteria bacterium TL4]